MIYLKNQNLIYNFYINKNNIDIVFFETLN